MSGKNTKPTTSKPYTPFGSGSANASYGYDTQSKLVVPTVRHKPKS
ncbi:hypothetical protein PROFUN_16505, partial [Planoprotostelium fungivorum]